VLFFLHLVDPFQSQAKPWREKKETRFSKGCFEADTAVTGRCLHNQRKISRHISAKVVKKSFFCKIVLRTVKSVLLCLKSYSGGLRIRIGRYF